MNARKPSTVAEDCNIFTFTFLSEVQSMSMFSLAFLRAFLISKAVSACYESLLHQDCMALFETCSLNSRWIRDHVAGRYQKKCGPELPEGVLAHVTEITGHEWDLTRVWEQDNKYHYLFAFNQSLPELRFRWIVTSSYPKNKDPHQLVLDSESADPKCSSFPTVIFNQKVHTVHFENQFTLYDIREKYNLQKIEIEGLDQEILKLKHSLDEFARDNNQKASIVVWCCVVGVISAVITFFLFLIYHRRRIQKQKWDITEAIRSNGGVPDTKISIHSERAEGPGANRVQNPDGEADDDVQLKYGEAFKDLMQNVDGVQGLLMNDIIDEIAREGQEVIDEEQRRESEQGLKSVGSEGYAVTKKSDGSAPDSD